MEKSNSLPCPNLKNCHLLAQCTTMASRYQCFGVSAKVRVATGPDRDSYRLVTVLDVSFKRKDFVCLFNYLFAIYVAFFKRLFFGVKSDILSSQKMTMVCTPTA